MLQPDGSDPDPLSGEPVIAITLFAVEPGDASDESGYLVRFSTKDQFSAACLGGLLFSLPSDKVRHLMHAVWWLEEDAMRGLVERIPSLRTQITNLASGEQTLH